MKRLLFALGIPAALVLVNISAVAEETVLLPTVRPVDKDIVEIFTKRRVTLNDRGSAYIFNPFICASCHSNWPGNTAPIFYGNSNYSEDQWEPAIGSLAEFEWEEVSEHEEIFEKGVAETELLIKSW